MPKTTITIHGSDQTLLPRSHLRCGKARPLWCFLIGNAKNNIHTTWQGPDNTLRGIRGGGKERPLWSFLMGNATNNNHYPWQGSDTTSQEPLGVCGKARPLGSFLIASAKNNNHNPWQGPDTTAQEPPGLCDKERPLWSFLTGNAKNNKHYQWQGPDTTTQEPLGRVARQRKTTWIFSDWKCQKQQSQSMAGTRHNCPGVFWGVAKKGHFGLF